MRMAQCGRPKPVTPNPQTPAINTGRTLCLYERAAAAKAHCLPRADALIAGVGTRVYFRGGGTAPDGAAPDMPDGAGRGAPDGTSARGGGGSLSGGGGLQELGGGRGRPAGAWVECEEWTATMAGGGWSRAAVAAAVDDAIAAFGADRCGGGARLLCVCTALALAATLVRSWGPASGQA
jgi:hypothetical protein